MRKIGVLTSGGDAPGMNAAVRAVVRASIDKGWTVFGIKHGYTGLIEGDFVPLDARNVAGIIQHGGTVLGTSRCDEFKTEDARARAHKNLIENNVEALVVIGGNGSQTGACLLSRTGFPVVGIASTIDNDLWGTEISIGVRGGTPGAFDRLLATRFGLAAVEQVADGNAGVLIGLLRGEVTATSLEEVISNKKKLDLKLFEAARILAI